MRKDQKASIMIEPLAQFKLSNNQYHELTRVALAAILDYASVNQARISPGKKMDHFMLDLTNAKCKTLHRFEIHLIDRVIPIRSTVIQLPLE